MLSVPGEAEVVLELAISDLGYVARRGSRGPWRAGFGIATLARSTVTDVASLLGALDAGNRLRSGRTP
jgi:hypothetical protein